MSLQTGLQELLQRDSGFIININVAVGLQPEVLFTNFDYHTH